MLKHEKRDSSELTLTSHSNNYFFYFFISLISFEKRAVWQL